MSEEPETQITEAQLNQLYALERRLRLQKPEAGLRKTLDEMIATVERTLGQVERQAAVTAETKRTYWTLFTYDTNGRVSGQHSHPYQSIRADDNYLASSLCESGKHAPCIDLDFKVTARQEPDRGTTSLLFQPPTPPTPDQFTVLLKALATAGVIEAADVEETLTWCRRISTSDVATGPFTSPIVISRVPTRLVASSNSAHRHLYLDVEMAWEVYQDLLQAFLGCKFISQKWYDWSREYRMSLLIRSGQTKDSVKRRVPGGVSYSRGS